MRFYRVSSMDARSTILGHLKDLGGGARNKDLWARCSKDMSKPTFQKELSRLVDEGVLERSVDSSRWPPRVTYRFTERMNRILHNPAASAILQSDRVAAEKLNTLTLSDREKEELLKETVEAFQRNIGPAVTKLAETCLSYSDSEKSFEDFSLVFQSVIGQAALGTFDLWMKFQGPARRVLQGCQDPNLYQEPRG
jgi:DNA-binding HxlR family transcriptional regulator